MRVLYLILFYVVNMVYKLFQKLYYQLNDIQAKVCCLEKIIKINLFLHKMLRILTILNK